MTRVAVDATSGAVALLWVATLLISMPLAHADVFWKPVRPLVPDSQTQTQTQTSTQDLGAASHTNMVANTNAVPHRDVAGTPGSSAPASASAAALAEIASGSALANSASASHRITRKFCTLQDGKRVSMFYGPQNPQNCATASYLVLVGNNKNNNKRAYAGQVNSLTHLSALLVLHDRGMTGACNVPKNN